MTADDRGWGMAGGMVASDGVGVVPEGLRGRICLVVGGARGIGFAIAAGLTAAGATVIATSRGGEEGRACLLDVTDPAAVIALTNRLGLAYERLDTLVYNAGVAGLTAPLERVGEEEWGEVLAVNVTGAYRVCWETIPLLRRSGTGRIILIASITGRRPLFQRVPYAASKTALIGFARSLALELGPVGVTVNTISPGYVTGERIDRVIAAQAMARHAAPDEVRAQFAAQSPLGRMVGPETIARLVTMLVGPAAQDVTDADINVSAGVWMD